MEIKKILLLTFIIFLILFMYFFVGFPEPTEDIVFGVNFSQKHARQMGLDWKETYLALLDDLQIKNLKLITHWDLIEKERGNFFFDDLDWQIEEAQRRDVKIILVIGMKTGRWPECHIPEWAKGLSKEQQQERILELVKKIVIRYKNQPSIVVWEVENEPLFPFGECTWKDKNFLKKEIALVKSLDSKRPILVSDSGEGSFWITSARLADIVGITMYKKVWFREAKIYVFYPFPPTFYWRKARIIKNIFKKDVICVELQTEPWCPNLLYNCSIEEQKKSMDLRQFKYNIEFAKRTGLNKFYLWGGEWWYWMKEKQGNPEIWEEAKKLFQ